MEALYWAVGGIFAAGFIITGYSIGVILIYLRGFEGDVNW